MSKGFFNFDSIIEDLIGYVEARLELLKVEVKEKLVEALSKVVLAFLLVFTLFTGLIFFCIALSIKLNLMLESSYLGYLIIGFSFLIVTLACYLFLDKKKLSQSLANRFHKSFSKDDDQEQT